MDGALYRVHRRYILCTCTGLSGGPLSNAKVKEQHAFAVTIPIDSRASMNNCIFAHMIPLLLRILCASLWRGEEEGEEEEEEGEKEQWGGACHVYLFILRIPLHS